MKRKDVEKICGEPMFPRLHVNDTEKGGPRAPPRNKMALYEHLCVPSQRFNHVQGSGLERSTFFPHHLPSSTTTRIDQQSHARQSNDSNFYTPLVQLERGDKVGEEDEFQAPVFVQSRKDHGQRKALNTRYREKLTPFSPSYSICSTKLQSTFGRDAKHISSQLENSNGCMLHTDHSAKSTIRKMNELSKAAKSFSDTEHQDHLAGNISRLHESDQHERSSSPQSEDSGHGDVEELTRYVQSGSNARPDSDSQSGMFYSSDPDDDNEYPGDHMRGSQPVVHVEKSDDVSETSMVDSVSVLDFSPDDVVGIIGQKRFWKARRAIVKEVYHPNCGT